MGAVILILLFSLPVGLIIWALWNIMTGRVPGLLRQIENTIKYGEPLPDPEDRNPPSNRDDD